MITGLLLFSVINITYILTLDERRLLIRQCTCPPSKTTTNSMKKYDPLLLTGCFVHRIFLKLLEQFTFSERQENSSDEYQIANNGYCAQVEFSRSLKFQFTQGICRKVRLELYIFARKPELFVFLLNKGSPWVWVLCFIKYKLSVLLGVALGCQRVIKSVINKHENEMWWCCRVHVSFLLGANWCCQRHCIETSQRTWRWS